MKTVQPKIDSLLFESLGFIPRISSTGQFSSPPLTIKFLILVAWRIAAPHIILEDLSQWESILPSPAVSSCTSHSNHSVVASLVWTSPVEFLHLNNTSWTALRETPSHFLVSASWASPHTQNKLLQAGLCFTLCPKQVHKHKLRVLVCKHNAEPESWQWLYSERSHHVCEHPLQLLFGLGLYHTLHTSSSSPNVQKSCWTFPARVPRLSYALSPCSSASSKKPTVSD